MKTIRLPRTIATVAAVAALAIPLAACGDDKDDSAKKTETSTPASAPAAAPSSAAGAGAPGSSAPADMASTPFGSACASVPATGAGSFTGMAKDPVATAASNNPALSTLVAAVKAAGLVDTLNTAQNITVFAPSNDAFAKVPKDALDKLLADKDMLTKVLTYHVVGQRLAPAKLDNGSFETLEKQMVTTKGSGTMYTVNDASKVVCGNVQTSNATVYIVDTVLMPPAS
ncbi:fasciclin domain-containing protein [Streptomyces sp. SID3343]|uniref:fasciclin domain-containing protein n=1 Tax=Streptomyces sp. SID3343 TaxID=2690260 RepID=UPI00136B43C3|nr:fasciclin domain-containing protein [Streptomyces sp. SID3343]MYW00276.1 fasciclin domain-containing protein [Streptomyces sp. SID3343]